MSCSSNNIGKIYNCINYGNIIPTDTYYGNGIYGIGYYLTNISIENCFNYGKLGKKESRYVAGIAGYANYIKECANYGSLNGESYTAGICLYNYGSNLNIENSFNRGDIYAESGAAGISTSSSVNIKNSYNARKNLWNER